MLQKIAGKILMGLKLYSLYDLKKKGPLYEDGWFRSYEQKDSIDLNGNPIPWITYPAIDFLKNRIYPGMSVFEYGCGGSTLWWASCVKEVISVEHDQNWYQKISPTIPQNVNLIHINLEYGGAYSKKIGEFDQKFDIVVIDGRDRVNCAINAVRGLKPEGVIIWDNTDRKQYEEGFHFLYKHGFRSINFIGMCPIVNLKSETSIFYRDHNCLNI